MSKVHYRRALVPGIWQPGRGTACGYGLAGPPTALPVTGDPAKVTCLRCRRAANLNPDTSFNRIMEVLRAASGHLTIAQVARRAQVNRTQVAGLLHRLAAGRLADVDRAWPNSYLLRQDHQDATPGQRPATGGTS